MAGKSLPPLTQRKEYESLLKGVEIALFPRTIRQFTPEIEDRIFDLHRQGNGPFKIAIQIADLVEDEESGGVRNWEPY
jgi:hypothetical protein